MQNVRDYWVGKDNRAKVAAQHTKTMQEKYEKEIETSAKETTVYNEYNTFAPTKREFVTHIVVEDIDSVSALMKENATNRIAVLNFASYKEPGGGFLSGSSAQEESLCHESFLYNVISQFQEYYENNCKMKNKALYKNRALYSRDIVFEKNGEAKVCDVLTCACPNLTAAKKYCNVSNRLNTQELVSRCDFVLDIFAEQGADTIILGAFGCGVFGQDPYEVATIFKDLLTMKYDGVFGKIVFAIPQGNNGNLDAFNKIFA